VLYEWAPLVFADEYSIAFLSIYYKLTGLALDLDLVCVLTHTWPIKTYLLESTAKVDFSAEPAGLIMHFLQLSLGFLLPHAS